MATANDVLRIAAGEIGYSRWNDPQTGTKYGRWYADLVGKPYFGMDGVPFCAMGASWTFDQAGVRCAGFPGAYTPDMLSAAKRAGAVLPNKKDAQPGDVLYFNWDGGVVDHVGFCEIPRDGYVQTIEFNTSNGQVCRRTRDWSTVEAAVRPEYTAPAPKVEGSDAHVRPVYNAGGPIYRAFNPNSGEHFYSTKAEIDSLPKEWAREGVAWDAPKGGTVAVYRMYNPNGMHLFTASYSEAYALERLGWIYEGVPFFGKEHGDPIYRLSNPNTGDHLLTRSKGERDAILAAGWDDEGVAFYV